MEEGKGEGGIIPVTQANPGSASRTGTRVQDCWLFLDSPVKPGNDVIIGSFEEVSYNTEAIKQRLFFFCLLYAVFCLLL